MIGAPRFLKRALPSAIAMLAMFVAPAIAREPAPSPAPLRSATNLCTHAPLYSWLPGDNLPTPAHVDAANFGERFEIASGPRRTLEGHGYYETTIPVGAVGGYGAHYWVAERCFVLAPESGRH
jgi:hypothetical protein